jgi:RNA polymerase sigma-70 factor (ECF subfamily)
MNTASPAFSRTNSTLQPEAKIGWFPTTHWTTVLSASSQLSPQAGEALERLCAAYWYPLYAYVRRKGHPPEDAEDLTQQFFLRLLQGNRLALAEPARGRFRTFLLTALNHFLINEWIKGGREKRGGDIDFLPLYTENPENIYAAEPADDCTPETAYERRWAAAVMSHAFDRLKADYSGDRARLLDALKPFVWGEKSQASQAEIAGALGLNPGAVRTAIHRLRRSYRELLRAEIAQTVATPEEVNDELRHLIAIVSNVPL